MASSAPRQSFRWDDPLSLDAQITPEERAVRDTAHAYCQEQLLPQVLNAFRHEKTTSAYSGAWANWGFSARRWLDGI